MADNIKVEIDRLKVRLGSMLQRVPESVNAGSYDTAVAYKKLAAKGHKLLTTANPKFVVLQQVCNQLSVYR